MAEHVDPAAVWSPFGAFSMAAIAGDGQTVYLKGQVSLDKAGEVVGPGDMPIQVEQTLANIALVLGSMGGVMADVVSLTHYTTDIVRFMATGDIRKRYFTPPYPVTTTVEVRALYRPDLVIEIAAIAEIARARFRRPAVN